MNLPSNTHKIFALSDAYMETCLIDIVTHLISFLHELEDEILLKYNLPLTLPLSSDLPQNINPPVRFLCPMYFTFDFLENNVEKSNNPV